MRLAEKYGIRYSIFVMGKDLGKQENREPVKEWSDNGHQIGNHTWSHPVGFDALGEELVRAEVARVHEAIPNATGASRRDSSPRAGALRRA